MTQVDALPYWETAAATIGDGLDLLLAVAVDALRRWEAEGHRNTEPWVTHYLYPRTALLPEADRPQPQTEP